MFGIGENGLEKNPEFAKFLTFLKTRINENGISIEKDIELKTVYVIILFYLCIKLSIIFHTV